MLWEDATTRPSGQPSGPPARPAPGRAAAVTAWRMQRISRLWPYVGDDRLATSAPVMPADLGAVIVEVDLLLTELLGHPLLIGHGVLVEPDPLPRHDPLLDHRLLLTQHHLVLGLRELGAGGGGIQVGVGDRLPLHPQLFALDRDGLLDLLGGDVLAQPDPAPLPLGGPDPQLLLRAGHGGIGGRPRAVSPHCVSAGRASSGGAVIVQAVVAPQLPLLGLGQVLVGVDPWGVLDQLLVVGDADVAVILGGLGEGDEAGFGAEQAGVDQGPLRLAGLVVEVDGVDPADAAAVPVDQGAALPATDGVKVGHLVHSFQPTPTMVSTGTDSS